MNTPLINKLLSLTRFLVLLLLLVNIGCQKELSKDTLGSGGTGGGGGTSSGSAQFSLVPSGSNCSDAVVSGNFEAGTALGTDAILTVTVNVTKTGDWTYTTSLVNGFVFAGAGNFTATGNQVITLQAGGTPQTAGNSNFKLNIGSASCLFSVTVVPAGSGGTTGEYYYKATIDGVNYTQNVTSTNDYEPGRGLGGVDDVAFGAGINYANPPLPAGKTEFGIDRAFMHHYTTATKAQFKAFFATGDYAYSALSNDQVDNGIRIYWTDTKGEVWDSRDKADQTSATFKIISAQDFTDIAGDYNVKVKVQFNCKLYNSAGASKTLTNGEAVVVFGML